MKHMLALFITYLCCSFVLTFTRVSITSAGTHKFLSPKHNKKHSILTEEFLRSANGRYEVKMGNDCNLVVYNTNTKAVGWSSNTKGRGEECFAIIQKDGNFVIYTKRNIPVWHTHTGKRYPHDSPFRLMITNKGNLILFNKHKKLLWASFGKPVPEKVLNATKEPTPRNVKILIRHSANVRKDILKNPTMPVNLDPNKKIKNKIPRRKKIPSPPSGKLDEIRRLKIEKRIMKKSKIAVWLKEGPEGWRKLKALLAKKGVKDEETVEKVKKAFNSKNLKAILKILATIAKMKIKQLHEKKIMTFIRKPLLFKFPKLTGIRKRLPWTRKVKAIFDSQKQKTSKGWKAIKRILRAHNFKGVRTWWKRLHHIAKTGTYKKFVKAVTQPPLPPKARKISPSKPPQKHKPHRRHSKQARIPFKPSKTVTSPHDPTLKWRLVLRTQWYLTYYWNWYYVHRWCHVCWRRWWWFWWRRRCRWYGCGYWVIYPHWYWGYYHYWHWEPFNS